MALPNCVNALDDLKLGGDQAVGVTIVKRALEEPISSPIPLSDDIAAAKTARGDLVCFIKRLFELDPLLCTDCRPWISGASPARNEIFPATGVG